MKNKIEQMYNGKQSTRLNKEESNKEIQETFLDKDNPTELLFEDYTINTVSKEYFLSDIVDEKGLESCLSINSNSESFSRSISQNDSQTNSNFTGINKNKSHTKLIIVG